MNGAPYSRLLFEPEKNIFLDKRSSLLFRRVSDDEKKSFMRSNRSQKLDKKNVDHFQQNVTFIFKYFIRKNSF